MAAGRPVVASAAGDVARLLVRAQAGVTCPPEDPAALAAAISHVASSPERARVMGANGRRYVQANYSRTGYAGALEAIISRLVATGRR
jgi:putative colanic acid biosynthesis glycosyltransferase WcaI